MTEQASHTLVAGSGAMGPSLALCLALAGHHTMLVARRGDALPQAEAAIENAHGELAEADLLPATAAGWRERLSFGTDLAAAARNIDFAFEAVAEAAEVKQSVFAALEGAAPADAILASTTSGMAVDLIAAKCE